MFYFCLRRNNISIRQKPPGMAIREVFMAVLLTAKQNFSKLQKYAVGKFTRAEEKQIQEYVERLMRDLELDDLTQ